MRRRVCHACGFVVYHLCFMRLKTTVPQKHILWSTSDDLECVFTKSRSQLFLRHLTHSEMKVKSTQVTLYVLFLSAIHS